MKQEKAAPAKRAHYVLPTESAEQFDSEHLDFENAIKPRDKIEQMLVEDIAYHHLKISQRRRFAFAIFKAATTDALYDLLTRQLSALDSGKAQILVMRWAEGEAIAKAEVAELLGETALMKLRSRRKPIFDVRANSLPSSNRKHRTHHAGTRSSPIWPFIGKCSHANHERRKISRWKMMS